MTPIELKTARHALGLSAQGLAQVLQIGSNRTVQRWEGGEREIPGPVIVLTQILLASAEARKLAGVPERS